MEITKTKLGVNETKISVALIFLSSSVFIIGNQEVIHVNSEF